MDSGPETRLPAGHQPYDALNGMRVGAVAGGLLGAFAAALTGFGGIWLVAGAAVAAGAVGYLYERRRRSG